LFTFLQAMENQSPSISRGGVGVYFDWCIVLEEALSVWANLCKHSLFVFELSKIGSFKSPPPLGLKWCSNALPHRRIYLSNAGVSKTQATDLENADLEKKKKRRTKGLFITLASKGCFCVCATSVFFRSLFARTAFSSSRKRRPCKQRPRKTNKETFPVVKPIDFVFVSFYQFASIECRFP